MEWTDNHCHLAPESSAELVSEAKAAGVTRLVTVGTDVGESRVAAAIARNIDGVWATAGVHPHEAEHGTDGLADLLDDPAVVAVGEAGLDYYYEHSPRPAQRQAFAAQVRLAHEHNMALVIHSRDAWDETFEILEAESVPDQTVFHCFSGGPAEAEKALALGCHLSFSGIVTFPKAPEVQASAEMCPLDRLLIETDSPYLTPVPNRGKRNRPEWVVHVGRFIAGLVGVSDSEIAERTTANAIAFYGLSSP